MYVRRMSRPQNQFPEKEIRVFTRTSGGVARKVQPDKKESSSTVRRATLFKPFVCSRTESFTAISPARQRAAKNLFRSYLFNGYRRLSSQVGYWIVPVVLGTFSHFNPSKYRSVYDTVPPASCRLFNVRVGQEARRLPQQQGGAPCSLWRALDITLDHPVYHSSPGPTLSSLQSFFPPQLDFVRHQVIFRAPQK